MPGLPAGETTSMPHNKNRILVLCFVSRQLLSNRVVAIPRGWCFLTAAV